MNPNKREASEPILIQTSELSIPIFTACSNGTSELFGFKNSSGKFGIRLNSLKALQNLTDAGVKGILLRGIKLKSWIVFIRSHAIEGLDNKDKSIATKWEIFEVFFDFDIISSNVSEINSLS